MSSRSERRTPPSRRKASLFVGSDIDPMPFTNSRNLSLSGIFLTTDAKPEIGSQHELAVAWGDDVFSCMALIVRQAVDGVALKFIDPDTYFLQALQEIMATSPPVDIVPGR